MLLISRPDRLLFNKGTRIVLERVLSTHRVKLIKSQNNSIKLVKRSPSVWQSRWNPPRQATRTSHILSDLKLQMVSATTGDGHVCFILLLPSTSKLASSTARNHCNNTKQRDAENQGRMTLHTHSWNTRQQFWLSPWFSCLPDNWRFTASLTQ